VAHRYAIIDRDRIELLRNTSGAFDLPCDQLSQILEMNVARHELGKRVYDGDDRLPEVIILHACGAPQATRSRHVSSMCCRARSIRHHSNHRRPWLHLQLLVVLSQRQV
jgi:hypothetical protein